MNKALNEKNKNDFDKNTNLLNVAIEKIHRTSSLATTIAELSRLTGLHRNAISNRIWPGQKLNIIKEQREKLKKKKIENLRKVPPVKIAEDKLDNAKRELVYWFTKCSDNEQQIKQLSTNLKRMSDARNDYEKMLKQERLKTIRLTSELNQLKELIR